MLIFFMGAIFSMANAQNIFTTQVHTTTSETNVISIPEVNTFSIDEPAKLFTHSFGSADITYSILLRTLEMQNWKYELVNAEGVLVTVIVDQNFKTFEFHLSTDPVELKNIYSNQ